MFRLLFKAPADTHWTRADTSWLYLCYIHVCYIFHWPLSVFPFFVYNFRQLCTIFYFGQSCCPFPKYIYFPSSSPFSFVQSRIVRASHMDFRENAWPTGCWPIGVIETAASVPRRQLNAICSALSVFIWFLIYLYTYRNTYRNIYKYAVYSTCSVNRCILALLSIVIETEGINMSKLKNSYIYSHI